MNSSNRLLDLRIRRTYKLLWDALMLLLTERDFEEITVTEICERAMVHRTTFYKHYEDKYALLLQGMQDEITALFQALDAAAKGFEPIASMITVFEHVLTRKQFYSLMLCGEGFGKFNNQLRKLLAERLAQRLQAQENPLGIPISLHTELQAAAMVSMIAWWLENDCGYSTKEMTHYLAVHFETVRLNQHDL